MTGPGAGLTSTRQVVLAFLKLLARAALTLALAWAARGWLDGFPFGFAYDDAWFYAQIGYYLGTKSQSTFDGIHTTSGYHLLWGGMLGTISALLSFATLDRTTHLLAFHTLYLFLAVSVARAFGTRPLARWCLFALSLFATVLTEALLLGALVLLLARLEETRGASGPGRLCALLAAFLIPLARIDAAIIPLVYALPGLAGLDRGRASTVAAATAAGLVTHVGLMLALFGNPFSVSSTIKAGGAGIRLTTLLANLGLAPTSLGHATRALVFFVLSGAVFWLGAHRAGLTRPRLLLSLGTIMFTLLHLLTHTMPFWCYLPAYLLLFATVAEAPAGERGPVRLRSSLVIGVATLLAALVIHKVVLCARNREIIAGAREFAARVAEAVPPGGRIYQYDGAGFVGFFSGRSVVNGDGLVNSHGYARRLRERSLAGYLDEEGICFVIDNVDRGASDVLVDIGGLVVLRASLEELVRTRTWGSFRTTDFILYRRRLPACAASSPAAMSYSHRSR